MTMLCIFLAVYLAGVFVNLGYSVELYRYTHKFLGSYILIVLGSWYMAGSILGTLLVQKRQRERMILEAQQEAMKNKNPLIKQISKIISPS